MTTHIGYHEDKAFSNNRKAPTDVEQSHYDYVWVSIYDNENENIQDLEEDRTDQLIKRKPNIVLSSTQYWNDWRRKILACVLIVLVFIVLSIPAFMKHKEKIAAASGSTSSSSNSSENTTTIIDVALAYMGINGAGSS